VIYHFRWNVPLPYDMAMQVRSHTAGPLAPGETPRQAAERADQYTRERLLDGMADALAQAQVELPPPDATADSLAEPARPRRARTARPTDTALNATGPTRAPAVDGALGGVEEQLSNLADRAADLQRQLHDAVAQVEQVVRDTLRRDQRSVDGESATVARVASAAAALEQAAERLAAHGDTLAARLAAQPDARAPQLAQLQQQVDSLREDVARIQVAVEALPDRLAGNRGHDADQLASLHVQLRMIREEFRRRFNALEEQLGQLQRAQPPVGSGARQGGEPDRPRGPAGGSPPRTSGQLGGTPGRAAPSSSGGGVSLLERKPGGGSRGGTANSPGGRPSGGHPRPTRGPRVLRPLRAVVWSPLMGVLVVMALIALAICAVNVAGEPDPLSDRPTYVLVGLGLLSCFIVVPFWGTRGWGRFWLSLLGKGACLAVVAAVTVLPPLDAAAPSAGESGTPYPAPGSAAAAQEAAAAYLQAPGPVLGRTAAGYRGLFDQRAPEIVHIELGAYAQHAPDAWNSATIYQAWEPLVASRAVREDAAHSTYTIPAGPLTDAQRAAWQGFRAALLNQHKTTHEPIATADRVLVAIDWLVTGYQTPQQRPPQQDQAMQVLDNWARQFPRYGDCVNAAALPFDPASWQRTYGIAADVTLRYLCSAA
jgi:hypothetical protein